MTLAADCTTTKTIQIPSFKTLDGAGHTITATGKLYNFGLAVIEVNGTQGHIKNLTLDGSKLAMSKIDSEDGVGYNNSRGTITNSTIRGFSGAAVDVVGGGVDLTDTSLSSADTGIVYWGFVAGGTITGGTVSGQNFGISAVGAGLDVDNVTITNSKQGVTYESGAEGTVTNSHITPTRHGVVATDLLTGIGAYGNTIVGPGGYAGVTAGVLFAPGSFGEVDGNAISNFVDTSADDGCGIYVDANANVVTIDGHNTFPAPPNEHDICDHRVSAAARSGGHAGHGKGPLTMSEHAGHRSPENRASRLAAREKQRGGKAKP